MNRNKEYWKLIAPLGSLRIAADQQIQVRRGDMAWSSRIKKWVRVFTLFNGEASKLGKVWFSTSNSPFGEWSAPIHIATHANYTFYNPKIHSAWLPDESPWLYFEGTYTSEFADRAEKTPRYDYNQVLYRVDLDAMRPVNSKESKK